jgi:hypothetical protein
MGTYHDALAEAEKLLREGKHDNCSMDCGKMVEGVLKELLRRYLENASDAKCRSLKSKLPAALSFDRLTLGQIAKLYESEPIFQSQIEKNDTNRNELPAINLRMIAHIRNQAAHINKAVDLEKSDAYILYGSLLKLLKIVGLLDDSVETVIAEKSTIKIQEIRREIQEVKDARQGNKEKFVPPVQVELITVVRNKSLGKFFIYLESDGARYDTVVNPDGKIIPFAANLFEEPEEIAFKELISSNSISDAQIKEYEKQKKLRKYSNEVKRPKVLPALGKKVGIETKRTDRQFRTKTILPRGCTVNGTPYDSGSEAIHALLSRGKIRKGNVPTSSYNAHRWLKENSSKFGFSYKRDVY